MALGLRLSGVPPLAAVVPAVTDTPATPISLRALQEPSPDQTEYQRAAQQRGRLPPRQILQVLPHGSSVLVSEVVRHLIRLPGKGFGQPSDPLLIL
jgi:hypothetical protein